MYSVDLEEYWTIRTWLQTIGFDTAESRPSKIRATYTHFHLGQMNKCANAARIAAALRSEGPPVGARAHRAMRALEQVACSVVEDAFYGRGHAWFL